MKLNVKNCVVYYFLLELFLFGSVSADDSDLAWSTYLGGFYRDFAYGIAVDDNENVYVTGETASHNFPVTYGAYDTIYEDSADDAFITKLNSDGSYLHYSTYLGGLSNDIGWAIAADDSGNAYITGRASSNTFPITPGAIDSFCDTHGDAFIAKLSSNGNTLCYSTFLGGNLGDEAYDIAVNSHGIAFVTGITSSIDFPTTPNAFDTVRSSLEAFVVKVNPSGTELLYSTFLGSSSSDYGYGIAIDSIGNSYITGYTNGLDFPTTNGVFDTLHNGSKDAFVTVLDSSGSYLHFSTYLGGNQDDQGISITIDKYFNVYISGTTASENFPTTPGTFDSTYNGSVDAFVTKLSPDLSTLIYSTFLGGTSPEFSVLKMSGIAVGDSCNAYVTGITYSSDFPITPDAYDTSFSGIDAFITKLNILGNGLSYSTFLGGSGTDYADDIAIDSIGNAYICGKADDGFPVTPGAYDETQNGQYDAFVAKMNLADLHPPNAINDLKVQLHGGAKSYWGNIYLSWSKPFDNMGVDHYLIYRSTEPYSLGEIHAVTIDTAFLDIHVVGHPYINFFYTVIAVDGSNNQSDSSIQVGEFDRPWIMGKN